MNKENLYPDATKEMSEKRASLALEAAEAFRNFNKAFFKEGVRFRDNRFPLTSLPLRTLHKNFLSLREIEDA